MKRLVRRSAIPVFAATIALATMANSCGNPPLGGAWEKLRVCESGNNYSINTGNGFYGAYQFDIRTWQGMGSITAGYARADLAPYWVQDSAAVALYAQRGTQPWPVCGPRAFG